MLPSERSGDMESRRLGNSDLVITAVGCGSWAIGGSGWEYSWGSQKDEDSIDAIRKALELGVNWIDTAAAYGLGHSEEIVARTLAGWTGARPYVFTKCGLVWDNHGKIRRSLKAASVRRECEESLRRLHLDAIDLYQIHWPPEAGGQELEEGWAALASLKKEGKVRWIGLSNFSVEQMKRAQAIEPVTSLQPPYSLVRRGVEYDILPYCKREGIGVIAYAPMASGLLTGAMTRERAALLPADDWRHQNLEFKEPNLSRNLALVDRLRAIAKRHGCSPGEIAIAWTLRNPAVTGAIVGVRSAVQADRVMRAAELRLDDEEIDEIESPNTE
jgi:aryl-alcohol dehydrogenase-like predicted oxidoreductase